MSTSKLQLGASVLAAWAVVFGAPALAQGREQYHADLLAAAETTCAAQLCVACHTSPAGGGPAGQAFFLKLSAAGYQFSNGASAKPALAKMTKDKTDSDGDGTLDAEEIRLATNPNSKDPSALCSSAEYGCLNVVRRGNPGEKYWVVVFCAATLLIGRGIRRNGS